MSFPGWGAGRKYRGILWHRSYELWFVDVSLLISINPSRRCWSRPYVRKLWSPLHQQWNLNRFMVYGGFHVVCIFFTNSTRFICCWWIQQKSCTVPKIYMESLYIMGGQNVPVVLQAWEIHQASLHNSSFARMRGMQRDVVLPAPWLRGDTLDYGLSGSVGIKWLTTPLSLPAF